MVCVHCGEGVPDSERARDGLPMHWYCAVRGVSGSLGHLLGLCSCYGGRHEDPAGLSKREAARIAAAEVMHREELRRKYFPDGS